MFSIFLVAWVLLLFFCLLSFEHCDSDSDSVPHLLYDAPADSDSYSLLASVMLPHMCSDFHPPSDPVTDSDMDSESEFRFEFLFLFAF